MCTTRYGAAEVLVAKGIEASAIEVDAAVDFDDEAPRRADEVGDVTTDDDLAAEGDAESRARGRLARRG